MEFRKFVTTVFILFFGAAPAPAAEKVCGVYTSIISLASRDAQLNAINAQPSFLMDKHKRAMGGDNAGNLRLLEAAKFNTVFMTIYPLWGKDWWDIPAARGLVEDALKQARSKARVHLGLSLFNDPMCRDISKYPGALRTIQCDGTRPDWVCFFDDKLWEFYIRNALELAKLSPEGMFIDPEAYGPECYLCFCDNCIEKFNKFANESMPKGLVKPDSWLHARGLWKKYTVDWHDAEVRRHANDLRDAVHKVDAKIQLSSLLWDYPVAVGIGDARQGYFRNLAIGLGTSEKPSWVLPEHTYYSDAADLHRIIAQMKTETGDGVRVLPGIRLLRQSVESLIDRAKVIRDDEVVGYWMYELSDLGEKTPIDFEGRLIDPPEKYLQKLGEMNQLIRGTGF